MEAPVKLLYAIAFAVFSVAAPVASPAQSLDLSLLSALCSDDYYEDTRANVVPSLPAKFSRLRRSLKCMGSSSPEIPMTK